MAKKPDKRALRIKKLFDAINDSPRQRWETVNQKGHDFYLDNQLTEDEKNALEDQGMPTFTVNRIIPVVEMLNYYATSNSPRWQAVGVEQSDSDVAALFADVADYVWSNSNGQTLYSNVVNDSITKGVGFLQVCVDPNADNGMGEIVIQQPDPFDVFIDPKSRDPLYRDASHIIVRKVLPKTQLIHMYPEYESKIKKASHSNESDQNFTKGMSDSNDFQYKDITMAYDRDGKQEDLIEYFECYERESTKYCNVFYQKLPSKEEMAEIQSKVEEQLKMAEQEMTVSMQESAKAFQEQVDAGEMLPERMQLEMEKIVKNNEAELASMEIQLMAEMQKQMSIVDNMVITYEQYNILKKEEEFAKTIVEHVVFHKPQVKLTKVCGDVTLDETLLPGGHYPIIPFSYKWTGTPFPLSAVSPLVGKQREINKAHQLMIHNASLGSSLRWIYHEGSVDTDYWEKFATAPGALLPVNQGYEPPKEILPAQLSNAFYTIVDTGKADMEYLAGIYSTAMGNSDPNVETYRGLLALDEYGTRRVKQWLKSSIEPALKHMGEVVKDYTQSVYKAHKVMRIVQPNNINEEKTVEINVPIYNDYGEAIGKWNDYETAKFDVRIVAGSTLPLNRWAYLAELKELMQLGVVDDIAVLAETDIRNKENIVKRKSLYSQLQSQLEDMEKTLQDKEGTIETLERQLVQAGIKNKIMQGDVEISKAAQDAKASYGRSADKVKAEADLTRRKMKLESNALSGKGE
tara:strand:- start:6039 stop:8270 length:2232 start_codon:yes stop_codon:yes gene_type:complete